MNALLDETRSERMEVGLSFIRQLRVSPTVERLLFEEKPANMTWGDFALIGMLAYALMGRSLRGDLRGMKGLVVRLLGDDPTSVGPADERRKPLTKAATR